MHYTREVTPADAQMTEDDWLAIAIKWQNEIVSIGGIPSRPVNTYEEEKEKPPPTHD